MRSNNPGTGQGASAFDNNFNRFNADRSVNPNLRNQAAPNAGDSWRYQNRMNNQFNRSPLDNRGNLIQNNPAAPQGAGNQFNNRNMPPNDAWRYQSRMNNQFNQSPLNNQNNAFQNNTVNPNISNRGTTLGGDSWRYQSRMNNQFNQSPLDNQGINNQGAPGINTDARDNRFSNTTAPTYRSTSQAFDRRNIPLEEELRSE